MLITVSLGLKRSNRDRAFIKGSIYPNKNKNKKGLDMKSTFFIGVVLVSIMVTACQVNSVRDTGGGAVAPSSNVTGLKVDSALSSHP